MTSNERSKLEAQYREPIDARAELAKCAAGLLVIAAVAASGLAEGQEDALEAAVSVPRVASGR